MTQGYSVQGGSGSWTPGRGWFRDHVICDLPARTDLTIESVHTWCPGTVPEYGTCRALKWHTLLSSSRARIRARCRWTSRRLKPCTRAQKWQRVPVCAHRFCYFWAVHAWYRRCNGSCFKMVLGRATWSNYIINLKGDVMLLHRHRFIIWYVFEVAWLNSRGVGLF